MIYTYGFIGCGNMGGALVRAASRIVSAQSIHVFDQNLEKTKHLADELGVTVATEEGVALCDFIFIGVKPQMLKGLFADLTKRLEGRSGRAVIISMCAGVTLSTLREMIPQKHGIIRIMPNIPASVGEGMMLYTCDDSITGDEEQAFTELMIGSGKLCKLDEKLIDAGSAISGCGPAFVSMFISALSDGGVECGLPRDKATLLACQTLIGTAQMLLNTDIHPEALKDAVCSPGGSTVKGVHALEDGAMRSAVSNAVVAAYKKTVELGKQ